MDLSNLAPNAGAVTRDDFRRGRGHGSGNGKTIRKFYVEENCLRIEKSYL